MVRLARALLAFLIPTVALAWTPEAEIRIARKASTLAPPDLRLLIEKYESDFLQGVRDAAAAEQSEHHREGASGVGPLRKQIDARLAAAVEIVRTRRPMRELVYQLGAISHLLADANNPLKVGGGGLGRVEPDYEAYFARSLRKFPTVFYGLRDDLRIDPVVDAAIRRSRRFHDLLEEEYRRGGRWRTSSEFDDRSTAFGIASISYSRAVSDTVNAFYWVWKEAGGDVRTAEVLTKGNLLLNENVR
ncbi:MAG: hypothetical protein ACRD2J_06555 [Thermoanaerobaculia bacterium]